MSEQGWKIDGRDVFIQDWENDKEMTVEEAERRLNATEGLRADLQKLADDPDAGEMGGPFISISWVLERLARDLEGEQSTPS